MFSYVGTAAGAATDAVAGSRYAANRPMGRNAYDAYPVQYGIGMNNSMVNGGLNMLGGGTNLYGGGGAAVVPGNGVIYNGGGQSSGYAFQPSTYQQKYGGSSNQGQSMSLGQQLASEYQRAHNEGKAANENRYQSILNGDRAGAQNAMMQQLQSQYPGMSPENLQKLANDPRRQEQFYKNNPQYGGLRDRYTRNMGYLKGQGDQQKKDINSAYDKLNAAQQQNLAARGLLSSTIAPTMQTGVERKRQDSLANAQESINRQYYTADSQLSGDVLGFQERRNDTYPSMGEYAQLMMQLGQSGMIGQGYNGSYGGGQQTGVGTSMNGVPMVYGGQRVTSSRGVAMGSGGLNAPSAYSMARNY